MSKKSLCSHAHVRLFGSVKVGSKGQIVIPKEVRDLLHIDEGDTLLVSTKFDMAMGMVKSDNLEKFMEFMRHEMGQDDIEGS